MTSAEFACTCGRAKTMRKPGRINPRCENATSGREFFWRRRKKVAFPNEYGYVWTGPKSSLLVNLKNACIIPYCNAITKLTDQSENQLKLIFTECSWMLHESFAGNQPSLDYIFHECHLPSIVLSTNSGRCQPRSKATILKNMVRNWWN